MINSSTLANASYSTGAAHPAGDGSSEITQQSFQILKEARAIQHEKRRQLMHMEQMLPKAEKTLTEIEMLLVIIGGWNYFVYFTAIFLFGAFLSIFPEIMIKIIDHKNFSFSIVIQFWTIKIALQL